MAKMGRPTDDPKRNRLVIRLAVRDMEALERHAADHGTGLSEAARSILRGALGVPPVPEPPTRTKRGRGKNPHTAHDATNTQAIDVSSLQIKERGGA